MDPTPVEERFVCLFLNSTFAVSHYIKLLLHQMTQKKLILHDLMQIQIESLEHTNGLHTLENQVEYNSKGF